LISRTDDTPRQAYIAGRLAAVVKEQICRATVSFIAREGRKPGSYFWLRGGKRAPGQPVAVR
jgi:NADH:quinone reductase (non-electrogenic)